MHNIYKHLKEGRIKSICKNHSYILGIGIIIIWSSSFIGCLNYLLGLYLRAFYLLVPIFHQERGSICFLIIGARTYTHVNL